MAIRWYGDAIDERLSKAVFRGVIKGTEALKTRMVERIMQPPKTGLLYPRGKGRMHQASAPGQSPANDYGNLVKSITTNYNEPKLEGNVNIGAEYGHRLEYGFVGVDSIGRTYDMPARPFARPALEETTPVIRQSIADEINKALNK